MSTTDRNQAYGDILDTAVGGGITHWATIVEHVPGRYAKIRVQDRYPNPVMIDLDTVGTGLNRIAGRAVDASNPGYDSPSYLRMALLVNTLEEDYDATDADHIIQAALFGDIEYS